MTEREVREYLHSIKFELDIRRKKLDQLEELQAVASSCTVRTDKECIQTSGSGDKMANIVGRMVDLIREVEILNDNIRERELTVMKTLKEMTDDRQRRFLYLRYVDCNSFYETVMLMDLTDSTARRVDRKAISEFTKIINTISSGKSH